MTVVLRRMPYPYRAMLAVCSDLDQTPDRHVYWETMRFLNTTETTSMGPGVGLEVGNSIYFDMPPGQLAYWSTDDAGREMVRTLIRSGHIDCLHSYGDLAAARHDAGRALDELARHDCRLEVWVDHATAPTNFGVDIMHGHGDVPAHPAYHADLTIAHGVRYVWRGRVSSVTGQDTPAKIGGLWKARHPLASARTAAKEAAKHLLAKRGNDRYAMHGPNRVLREVRLRDGSAVQEFIRSNPHWGGVSSGETADGIGQVLTEGMLDRLVSREGVCILYTHLGKISDPARPLAPAAVAGFRRLAEAHRDGRVLVTTTRRALDFITARDRAVWSARSEGGLLTIDVRTPTADAPTGAGADIVDLAGLTFTIPDDVVCRIVVDGSVIEQASANPPDHAGRRSISLPWPALELPPGP